VFFTSIFVGKARDTREQELGCGWRDR